ncbi:hypothetical protein ABZ639_17055 [Saccharomonospora sp. NPDC006951]
MKTARIANDAALRFVSGLNELHEDHFPDGLTETDIDQMLAEVDRDIAEDEHVTHVRITHSFNDLRRARRAQRRSTRTSLRSLPTRLDAGDFGEVAA